MPTRSNCPSILLSAAISRSPCRALICTWLWLSAAVEKVWRAKKKNRQRGFHRETWACRSRVTWDKITAKTSGAKVTREQKVAYVRAKGRSIVGIFATKPLNGCFTAATFEAWNTGCAAHRHGHGDEGLKYFLDFAPLTAGGNS